MEYPGGCLCGQVRYKLKAEPMFVHACHCRQCQRVTGSAFVLNAIVAKDEIELISGSLKSFHFDGTSHSVFSCDQCATYVWSEYAGKYSNCWFVRVGTLDDAHLFPPDVHIYIGTKQPWVVIKEGTPCYDDYYDQKTIWPERSLQRLARLQAKNQ